MSQVQDKYDQIHPMPEWRYELKVRYIPENLQDLYEKDKVTFYYYYDQVIVLVYRFCCLEGVKSRPAGSTDPATVTMLHSRMCSSELLFVS